MLCDEIGPIYKCHVDVDDAFKFVNKKSSALKLDNKNSQKEVDKRHEQLSNF
jgi:hypothetical protein